MVEAIVLLSVYPGKEHHVKEEVNKLEQVKSCRITFGEYDLVAEVQAEKVKALGTIITKSIRSIEGITKSITLIISESLENNTDD
ncbi:MAG: Lrp/AsnC family transcriptional regulator [Candidatus Hodarchaeales archaeon]|jgi:DNA-binding Lrp family transcriptional regulator